MLLEECSDVVNQNANQSIIYFSSSFRSALSYCMIGHLKTILIILGGFLYFDENINLRQWIGIALTLFSSISYTIVRMREQKNNENQ